MLKKLVKYGNSNALVLDRSILALLNINEDSVVKLRIEGDTLIVRAEEAAKATDSMMLDIENIHTRSASYNTPRNPVFDMIEANLRTSYKGLESDPHYMKALEEWLPGTENAKKLQEAYGKIMKKYMGEIQLLNSEEFKRELDLLSKKYDGDSSSKDWLKEFLTLRLKYAPKLAQMDKEMQDVNASLGVPSGSITTKK
ncbi:AbrB/MazE/SpoVT family DNA-binding domain-containing protein [Candidatus Babeliales bacterium]|nr:AbrB/MazE/SpoVT family DNA-binding domain-containing protein [Candidatus Babeliales bacterium]